MKVLVSGCSFSQWPEYPGGPNTCWPRWLQEKHPDWEIVSKAEAAAGNQYIANSIVDELTEDDSYDMVLVMWSGVTRLDFLTNVADPDWSQLFDSYGFYRRLHGNKDSLGYIFSGGELGTWFANKVAYKMFYEQYKVSSHASLGYTNLMEMVKLQNFLEAKGKKYYFMSYVNYWGTGENISPNGDFGVGDITEVQHLVKALDKRHWIFTKPNGDGIYELAKEAQSFKEDGFHPSDEIQKQWADYLSERILTNLAVNM
jgi:hypothetical protein